MFAVIVIVFALVIAALYFMSSYRAHEATQAQLAAAAQMQADRARRSGRMGRGMRGTRRPSAPPPAGRAAEGGALGEQSLPQPESAADETGK